MKFSLLRYFSASGAFLILVLATSFWFLFTSRSDTQLVATVEHDNIVLATLLAGELSGSFPEHFGVSHTRDTLRDKHHQRHLPEIHRKIRKLVENSPIIAVNVFSEEIRGTYLQRCRGGA